MMNKENVQTRGVKFDGGVRTACSFMKIRFEDRRMCAEKIKDCTEDSLVGKDSSLQFRSSDFTDYALRTTLFKAISWSKKFGGRIFFDLNLPLPLWKSRDETLEIIKEAWE